MSNWDGPQPAVGDLFARAVMLEDWAAVRSAWWRFKEGSHGKRLEGELPLIEALFVASLTPATIKMFAIFDRCAIAQKCYGFVIGQELHAYRVMNNGLEMVLSPYCFIRSVFTLPGTPYYAVKALDDALVSWAKDRKHFKVEGACRVDFPARLARMYGYRPQSVMMGKSLEVADELR